MRKIVLSIFAVLTFCLGAVAQNQRVTGTVTDPEGTPAIGVTVSVVGTTVATNTDGSGNYSINAPRDGSLEFSYVGLQTKTVAVAGRTSIDVEMEADTHQIEDVIVVAFGTAKKEAFTGSAAVLDSEALAKRQSTNVVNTLAGQVAGVQIRKSSGQPGTEADIRIRGFGSLYSSNAPLIIVDGSPYEGSFSSINSSDIETFTVLKDAASNALYGARGANGVIMVTTKKGKGRDAVISVDIKRGVNSRIAQDYKVISDPGQYYETYYRGLYDYYYYSQGKSAVEANTNANTQLLAHLQYNVYNLPTGENLIGADGKLNPNATLGNIVSKDGVEYTLTPDNWSDNAFRKSTRQEYNATVTGGTERSSFFASLGYVQDMGIVQNSEYDRYSARMKADFQAKKWLKVGGNAYFANTTNISNTSFGEASSSGNLFSYTSTIAPIYPLFIRDGSGAIMKDSRGMDVYDYGDGSNGGLFRPMLGNGNPIGAQLLDGYQEKGNQFSISGYTDITLAKGLKLQINGSSYLREVRTTNYTNPYYGQYATSEGSLTISHSRTTSYNFQQLLTYEKNFDQHNFDVLFGHENYITRYNYLYGSKDHMFSPLIWELNSAVNNISSGSNSTEYNTEGYFARAQYNYAQKYFLSGSFRLDATSNFSPNHRWGKFWSVGGAWLLNEEEFLKNAEQIDLLKLKVSYGSQGNDGIGSYRYMDLYDVVNSGGSAGAQFKSKGREGITWETNNNFNVGAEFELLQGRIIGSVEYYYRLTEDMLFYRPTPESAGYTGYYGNIGNMSNKGFEVELTATLLRTKNINWTVTGNITHNTNKMLTLPEERKRTKGFESGNYWISEGGSIYDWYLKKYAGVNEYGQSMWYMDLKEDTEDKEKVTGITTTTKYAEGSDYVIGTAMPDYYGGLSTTLTAFGFDFTINFDYQIGGLVYDSGYAHLMQSSTGDNAGYGIHEDILQAWTPTNTTSNIPRYQFNDEATNSRSDRFLVDASYINLQSINCGYTVPNNITKRLGISNLRIYLSAENLKYWSRRQGLDPRQSWNGSSTAENYSPIKTISGGIQLSF